MLSSLGRLRNSELPSRNPYFLLPFPMDSKPVTRPFILPSAFRSGFCHLDTTALVVNIVLSTSVLCALSRATGKCLHANRDNAPRRRDGNAFGIAGRLLPVAREMRTTKDF